MLVKLRAEAAGLGDPCRKHRDRPLADHLADWRAGLLAKGNTTAYVELCHQRAESVVTGCDCRSIADFDTDAVSRWLALRRSAGMSR